MISIKSRNKYIDMVLDGCHLGFFTFLPVKFDDLSNPDGSILLPIQQLIDYKIASLGGIRYSRMLYTILSISMRPIRSDVTSRYKCRHVRDFRSIA